ncbi:cupin domain-containing protein [Desulfopila aestuarii]|uniref:Cupin domain-containing protein n=1 Tax=Desulfopila aestuarii DSM 18488 TaxID=1121416 RepID=A0A1M7YBI0_9BACT|nr:cupin domain-containing protein [Desulfopila aestuarii]SHO50010.1 Cupin domain-containing protein [Desulfopila aestuarii DSM 18488]
MSSDFTKAHFDFASLPWLTSPRKQLDLEGVALGLIHIPANEGYTFTHSHRQQEEVYIVIEGRGIIAVNDQQITLEPGDLVRVSPTARRALKANEEGLFIICAGGVPMGFPKNPDSRYMIDDGIPHYDDIPAWYKGREDIAKKNALLLERMEKSRAKREEKKLR